MTLLIEGGKILLKTVVFFALIAITAFLLPLQEAYRICIILVALLSSVPVGFYLLSQAITLWDNKQSIAPDDTTKRINFRQKRLAFVLKIILFLSGPLPLLAWILKKTSPTLYDSPIMQTSLLILSGFFLVLVVAMFWFAWRLTGPHAEKLPPKQ